MVSIRVSKFKATCLSVIERVRKTGQGVLITKRGVPVADIVPSRPQPKRKRQGFLGSMRGTASLAGDVVSPVTRTIIHAAKTDFSRLIKRACAGEQIVITRGDAPMVRLVPVAEPPHKRMFGALKGKARTGAAFFEPLPASELDAWEK